jgi:GTP cyclohydrolase I
MSIKIEVIGIPETMQRIESEYRDFLERVADAVVQEAPRQTPKRTGRAAAGWKKNMEQDSFEISNPVPYVQYLERGTRKMKAANNGRGIIGPTLTSIKGKIK